MEGYMKAFLNEILFMINISIMMMFEPAMLIVLIFNPDGMDMISLRNVMIGIFIVQIINVMKTISERQKKHETGA
jgi:hypothetical protein